MATKSLGTLTLDIVAKTAGFVQGMDKAQRESSKWKRQVKKDLDTIANTFKVAGAAAAAGLALMVRDTLSTAREIQNLSKVANTSTDSFQRISFAAQRYGVEQEKVADILKDTSDKVGDFLQTGGGPLADFFENIAPHVGVTAEEFRNLSGDQALGLYVSSLEKANLSQNEMTFFMEAIASDATLLLPLLKDNAKELGRLSEQADNFNAVISETELDQLNEIQKNIDEVGAAFDGLKKDVVLGALPAIEQLTDFLSDPQTIENATTLANAITTAFTFALNVISEVTAQASQLGEDIARIVGGSDIDDKVRQYQGNLKEIARLQDLVNNGDDNFLDRIRLENIQEENAALKPLVELYQDLADGREAAANIETKIPETSTPATGQGENKSISKSQRKILEEQEKAAQRLLDVYNNTSLALREQLSLYEDTSEAAQIRFEIENGGLQGITASQQQQLIALAEQVDARNEAKEAAENLLAVEQELLDPVERLEAAHRRRLLIIEAAGLSEQKTFELSEKSAKKLADELESLADKTKDAMTFMETLSEEAAKNIHNNLVDFFIDPLENGLDDIGDSFAKLVQRIAVEQATLDLQNFLGGYSENNQGSFLGSVAGFFAGAFDSGGIIPAGKIGLVGERGPEFVSGPATVTSRVTTERAMGGMSFNFNISAPSEAAGRKAAGQAAREVRGVLGGMGRYE